MTSAEKPQGVTELATESDFHDEMVSLYRRSGDAVDYWPHRFLAAVQRHGGLPYAKKLLAPGAPSAGFDRLIEAGRADLSVEYLALDKRFRHLFTKDERDEAKSRLPPRSGPAFPGLAPPDQPATVGELSEKDFYTEGDVHRVTVNRYERDPKARGNCIDHHGLRCCTAAIRPMTSSNSEVCCGPSIKCLPGVNSGTPHPPMVL